jgi:hypothetical protein
MQDEVRLDIGYVFSSVRPQRYSRGTDFSRLFESLEQEEF